MPRSGAPLQGGNCTEPEELTSDKSTVVELHQPERDPLRQVHNCLH